MNDDPTDVIVAPAGIQVVVNPRAVTLDVAAQMYGDVCLDTLAVWRRDEGFPTVKIGRRILVPVAQADAWFAARVTT